MVIRQLGRGIRVRPSVLPVLDEDGDVDRHFEWFYLYRLVWKWKKKIFELICAFPMVFNFPLRSWSCFLSTYLQALAW